MDQVLIERARQASEALRNQRREIAEKTTELIGSFVKSAATDDSQPATLRLTNNKHQPHLRLGPEHLDLCNSSSFNAASPRGAVDLPCSISLTAEGERPTRSPISAKVIPIDLARRALMRDAHVVMGATLRKPVTNCQRQPVTEFRENGRMPRPPDLPRFATVGPRIRWWREHRQRDRREFARAIGIPYSTLADLENDRAKSTKKLRKIAEELRLRLDYLETDEGEPETIAPTSASEWPLPGIQKDRLAKLTRTERELLEFKLRAILEDIEADRQTTRKTG